MEFSLIQACAEHSFLMENLMQFYIYDFSEWLDLDVMEDGSFEKYKSVESYWKEAGKSAYLVKKENQYAGFALVKTIDTNDKSYNSIAEFFILKRYRKQGLGKKVAFHIFNSHNGPWQVFQLKQNKPAQVFWHKVVNEYTGGNFYGYFNEEKCFQEFESQVFTFPCHIPD